MLTHSFTPALTHSDEILSDSKSYLTQPDNLSVIQIQGTDATSFLQGQLPCDVDQVTPSQGFFTGACTAKGQVISTLILIGHADGYLMILPTSLKDKLVNKLKMYVLRSKVNFTDISERLELITFSCDSLPASLQQPIPILGAIEHEQHRLIRLPGIKPRFLALGPDTSGFLSSILPIDSRNPSSSVYWHYDNIQTGLAWLNPLTSEKFIPQMLNLKAFGGISFDKGCYTGQEIVARAHYLGKVKRSLLHGQCAGTLTLSHQTEIKSTDESQSGGKIIDFVTDPEKTALLFVCSEPSDSQKNLVLSHANQDKISVIEFK